MTATDDLFEFPCDFPVKVMGRDSESFRTLTLAIVERHAGALDASRISERASSQGRFLGLTYTIRARAARSSTGLSGPDGQRRRAVRALTP